MKKGKISILVGASKDTQEVEAQIVSDMWAIHTDPTLDKKHYSLTHIPSGKRVWSSSKITTLKLLLQEPEFFEPFDENNLDDVKRLSNCIKRFCDRNTDLNAKPKKNGWQ